MSLFGGITKSLFGSGGAGASGQAVQELKNLKLPEIEDMKIELQQLVEQGQLSPEDAQAMLVEKSNYEGIKEDPSLKQAQLQALASLQEVGEGGMTAMDRANLAKITSEEQASSKGARDAILQNANARGVGGSGLELASQLQNAQDSATRASTRGLDVAAQAQQRALDAIMQSGQLAGSVRGQDFDQASKVASAQDQIAQFNAQNKQQVGLVNTAAHNNAQASNLDNKQNIANQNVGLANQQEQYNKGLIQQNFDNQYKKAGGVSGALQNQAAAQNAERSADMGLAGSLIGAGATLGAKKKEGGLIEGAPTDYDSQPIIAQPGEHVVKKEDVPEFLRKAHTDDDGNFDAAGFLDSITGGKYNYSAKGKS